MLGIDTARAAIAAGAWPFEEGSGTVTADVSGSDLSGKLEYGPVWTNDGKVGKALIFDGSNDRVALGSPTLLDNQGPFSVSAWIKPTSLGEYKNGWVMGKARSGGNLPSYGWRFGLTNSVSNALTFAVDYSSAHLEVVSVANSIKLNEWNHVAVTWDGTSNASGVKLFVNGTEVAYSFRRSGVGTRANDGSGYAFIGSNPARSRTFKGTIDEVRFFASALAPAEVSAQAGALGGSSDSIPPTVAVSTPAAGTTVSGSVVLTANASDNVGVAAVQFYINDTPLGDEDTTAPYSTTWNTQGYANGTYVIRASARDAAGNLGHSGSVSVNLSNTTTPASTKFSLNDRVRVVNGPLNVRSTANTSGTLLGTQATGNLGTVIGGPVAQGGYAWWNVNFDSGADGWSVENYLEKYTAPTADTTAPSVPTNLGATVVSDTQVNLTWTASTDNVGVVGYKVYRNGVQMATVPTTSYQNTGLSAGTTYSYTVAAYDAAGNTSAQTTAVSASTTTPPPPPPPVTGTGLGMALPAYFYPGALWDQSLSDSPRVGGYLIMNPNSGPGTTLDQNYVNAVNKAKAAGVKVLGYVHTSYGTRSSATVKAEIDQYKTWYKVDGIFLDEVSASTNEITYYENVIAHARSTAGTFVVLNPGTIPNERYVVLADSTVVFEGSYSTYTGWQPPSYASSYPATKFSHLVYAASSESAMTNAVSLAKQRNAGYLYVTNDVLPNPWDTLPPYWSNELALMGGTTSSGGDTTAPTIGITAPQGGATVSGTVMVTATASDNVGVVGVQFKQNGVNLGSEDTTAPYGISWNTAQSPNGSVTLTAVARDAAGNSRTSNGVTVTVSNTSPAPTASLTASALTINAGQTTTLSWSSTNASSCTGTNFSTNTMTAGSAVVSPTANTTYAITCAGAGGSVSRSVLITVLQPVVSTKFSLNDRVRVVNGPLNVRSTANTSGTLLGTQATGNLGTVIGGPVAQGGYAWWNVNFDSGADGWSVENYLEKYTAPTADTTAPSVPTNLTAVVVSSTQINLAWTASTDNVGVAGYRVFRNGTLVGTVTTTSYQSTGLSAGTTYSYTVAAYDAAGNTSAQTTARSATTAAAPTTGSWYKPPVFTPWQWQLTGTVDQNVDAVLFNIDLYDNSASVISSLKSKGKKVICYFSAGSYEDWRPDASQFPAIVLGKSNGWPGERWLDIRRIDLLGPIMTARMDMAKQKGCDGMEPDNIDGYTNSTGFPLTATDQFNYNKFIADEAHKRGLSIGLKNDVDQISSLEPYFDFAVNEQCFQYNECSGYSKFINAGKPVFNVEYSLSTSQFCSQANSMKFMSMKKNLDLDASRTVCW